MPICKFFQRGICRYGNQCINDHSYGQHFNVNHSLDNEIRTTITAEAESALQGKQWLLSCFAPFKDRPNLADFIEDLSPEEMRWSCYQAKENGTIVQYTQELQSRLAEATQKFQMLQNPSREMLQFLVNLRNDNVVSKSNNPFYGSNNTAFGGSSSSSSVFSQPLPNSSNLFNKPQTGIFANNNIFGNATSTGNAYDNAFVTASPFSGSSGTGNVFGTAPAENKNIFATANNAFGPASANAFGAPSTDSGTNIFAQAANNIFTQGAFSAPQSSSSSFLFTPPTTQNANVFGAPSTQNQPTFGQPGNVFTNNIFGNTNTFGSSAPNNIFGGSQNTTTTFANLNTEMTTTFGTDAVSSSSIFAAPPQSSNAFGDIQNTQTNSFGTVQNQSPFLSPPNVPTNQNIFQINQNPISSAFDNPFTSSSNAFNVEQNQRIDMNVYSKLEELTPEMVQIYESGEFELGKIPILPPTYEMCHPKL